MTADPHTDRAEGAVQVGLMLAVGGVAAAASWAHVVSLAASHGQPGWLAVADAAVIETTAVSAGLEVRRRRRSGQSPAFVLAALVVAVVLSLAAQVAEAERSVWGWVLAAVPAVGFLVLAKIALGRTAAAPVEDHAAPQPAPAGAAAGEPEDTDPPEVPPARLPPAEWEPPEAPGENGTGNGHGPTVPTAGSGNGKRRDRVCHCADCGGRLVPSATFYRHRRTAENGGGSR
jgi:hypothetical protein